MKVGIFKLLLVCVYIYIYIYAGIYIRLVNLTLVCRFRFERVHLKAQIVHIDDCGKSIKVKTKRLIKTRDCLEKVVQVTGGMIPARVVLHQGKEGIQ